MHRDISEDRVADLGEERHHDAQAPIEKS